MAALGIDWARPAWVGTVLRENTSPQVLLDLRLDHLIHRVSDATCVAVDMPLGLPDVEREADKLARAFVGPRRNSVFMTPPRSVLAAPSYAEANLIAERILGGKKISQQAWGLRINIRLVENVADCDARLIEVHPEVSFRAMNGSPLHPKNSWNGQAARVAALAKNGIVIPDHLDEGGNVPVADLLDSAAAAWSAQRFSAGIAESLPPAASPAQREVIWY